MALARGCCLLAREAIAFVAHHLRRVEAVPEEGRDALAVQAHVMETLEKAEVCEDPERKRAYLSFVVVGGGFSGVEITGEINDLVRVFNQPSTGFLPMKAALAAALNRAPKPDSSLIEAIEVINRHRLEYASSSARAAV